MIKPNTLAFSEIVMCAIQQGIIENISLDGGLYIDISDYFKIKDLEW